MVVGLLLIGAALVGSCLGPVLAQELAPPPPGPAPLCQCGKGFLAPLGTAKDCAGGDGVEEVIVRNVNGDRGILIFPPVGSKNLAIGAGGVNGAEGNARWMFFKTDHEGGGGFWGWGCQLAATVLSNKSVWVWASALDSATVSVLGATASVASVLIQPESFAQWPSSAGCIHTVRPGENLFRISQRYGTTAAELAQLNGISDPSLIHSGQVLQVPCEGEVLPAIEPAVVAAVPPTSAPPAVVLCGAPCVYAQEGVCYQGNCLDGSQNCGTNWNCGYVPGCSSGQLAACPPGAVPAPVTVPTATPAVTPALPTSSDWEPVIVFATSLPPTAIPTTPLPTPSSSGGGWVEDEGGPTGAMFTLGLAALSLLFFAWLFGKAKAAVSRPGARLTPQPVPVWFRPQPGSRAGSRSSRQHRVPPRSVKTTGKSILVPQANLVGGQQSTSKPPPASVGAILGSGGQGIVRKEQRGGQIVAVKYTTIQRVGLEVEILQAVSGSEHFPKFVETTTRGTGQVEVVMEFIEGENLFQVIKRRGMLPITLVTLILKGVAEGLQLLHRRGYIYVDLKPGQVMLTPQRRVVIVDPGSGTRSGEGVVTATPGYSHPDAWVDTPRGPVPSSAPAEPHFDVYSLGILAHGLVTCEWPPDPLGNWRPDVSKARYFRLPRMRSVVQRALSGRGRLEDFM